MPVLAELVAGALHLVGELLPDRVELEVDHALGYGEDVVGGEPVEQGALEAGAADVLVLVGEPLAEGLLELVQVLEAQLLRPSPRRW